MSGATANPLVRRWLAAAPPVLPPAAPPPAGSGPPRCLECGLQAASADYRVAGPNQVLCGLCALGRTAAWDDGGVRLALLPEYPQGALNALVIRITVTLLQARRAPTPEADAPVTDIALLRQHHLLEAFQQRARQTQTVLPCTASAARLRRTLLALPPAARADALEALSGLRYLPDPADPAVVVFFRQLSAAPRANPGSPGEIECFPSQSTG